VRTWGRADIGERDVSSRPVSALLWRRSLLGRNSERDADARSFLTRRTRCSLQSLGDLCERLFTGHAFQQPKVVFRPWSPRRGFLGPSWWLGHVCSLTCLLGLQICIDSRFSNHMLLSLGFEAQQLTGCKRYPEASRSVHKQLRPNASLAGQVLALAGTACRRFPQTSCRWDILPL
jgi:hypothetical protein